MGTIICVDDDKWTLTVLSDQLTEWFGKDHMVEKALSGNEALELIDSCAEQGEDVMLCISDYVMPSMKGDELLEQVRLRSPMTRRIMLTGFAAIDGITNAINKAGIYRFMAKPWDNKDMLLTVLQALRSYEQDRRAEKLAASHLELYRRFETLSASLQTQLDQSLSAFAALAEQRAGDAPGHASRVADYCERIAKELKIAEQEARTLKTAAYLHDIGKLNLTDEELLAVRNAENPGKEAALAQAKHAERLLANLHPEVLQGVMFHMERIDGQGPHGITSANIPLDARIIGICNRLDTLNAAYPEIPPANLLARLSHEKGKLYDGLIFDTLAKVLE